MTLKSDFEVVRRNKVYEEVAKQIERLILKKLKPGDKLPPERELAEMLGVSRSSVRDAIRSLELMGLVEPRQGAGTIVRETSAEMDAGTVAHAILLEGNSDVVTIIDPTNHPAEKTGNIPDGWTNKSIRAARDSARASGKLTWP